jgi:hypothetical protein
MTLTCLLLSYYFFSLQWPDRRDSSLSANSSTSQKHKKDVTRQRAADRRLKLDAQGSTLDAGHIIDNDASFSFQLPNFAQMVHATSLDRSSSDQSTGSLLYGKSPGGTLIGKSSSLIFPTGLNTNGDNDNEAAKAKRRRINLALDQCEAVRFPFKKKLILTNLDLSAADIPLRTCAEHRWAIHCISYLFQEIDSERSPRAWYKTYLY